jgi:methionyl-tRNA formyltransferase
MARLVYLGTPDTAVPPLQALVASGHEVALVVTRADKRRGRGAALAPSPVKAAAVGLGLPVTSSLEEVTEVGAELGVVVAFGRIIPASVLDRLPMVNLHFSLLPRWRGAAPVERAILEGDAETGVCLMAVEAGLDTGPIYDERSVVIGEEETADELRARLVDEGCTLLVAHLRDGPAGLPQPRDQAGTPTYAEKVHSGEHQLHWDRTAADLARVVRLGRAWTTFRGRRLGIVRASLHGGADGGDGDDRRIPGQVDVADAPAGTLVGTEVVAGDGRRIRLITVHPEGKRPMAAADWRNGVQPRSGEALGT